MTVSTSGILPGIERFAAEKVRPKLALSLNAPNDAIRESIMPITRKWNIEALFAALRTVPLRTRERMTFEYVLLAGVNDSISQARTLGRLLSPFRSKVNLIPFNPFSGSPFQRPTEAAVTAFQDTLSGFHITATVRKSMGPDVLAACGQLARELQDPLVLTGGSPT